MEAEKDTAAGFVVVEVEALKELAREEAAGVVE